jgi:hypothetical protein
MRETRKALAYKSRRKDWAFLVGLGVRGFVDSWGGRGLGKGLGKGLPGGCEGGSGDQG